jgi:isopenicillin N synthase-like dioxygenase
VLFPRRISDAQVRIQAKRFFALPLSKKLEYQLRSAELNQGYTADGAEANGGIDHKECYEHRRFCNPSCPSSEEISGFRETLDEFYGQCLGLGLNVLKCLAMAMNLGEGFFEAITKRADPQLRLIHYPESPREMIEQPGHARIIPHTDFGLCTLLFQDEVGGLEVDPFHTGEFKAATPRPGTVLINIADLLQRLTNDRCRSTLHRVVSPPRAAGGPGDVLPARYSIPFFIHPDPEAMIDPVVLPGEEKHYEVVNAGEWRTWNTRKNYHMLGEEVLGSVAVPVA